VPGESQDESELQVQRQTIGRQLSQGMSRTISNKIPAVVNRASSATSNIVRQVSLEVNQAKKDFKLGGNSSFMRSTSLSQAVESSSTFSRSCGQFTNLPKHLEEEQFEVDAQQQHVEEHQFCVAASAETLGAFARTNDLSHVPASFGGVASVIQEDSTASFQQTSLRSSSSRGGVVKGFQQNQLVSQHCYTRTPG